MYGTFISFQALVLFGAMGDLGLGGSVGVEANRLLGARKVEDLRHFLALARSAFFIMALVMAALFILLSPWLATLLGVTASVHGSIFLLFLVGGISIAATVLANFTSALSNVCRNLTWPIIPNLLVSQLAMALHLWVAQAGGSLWMQAAPYGVAIVATMAFPWIFTKISHPTLAELHSVHLSWKAARRLFSQSFWVYLWSVGFLIYMTTDRLVINRYFGPELASLYYVNYKPAEIAVFLLITLTFVSLTKIVQWHCSPDSTDKTRAIEAALKLQKVEVFLGIAAALFYLAFNDVFIEFWLGPGHRTSLVLQALFAGNLAVTVSGDAGTKIAGQISARGTVFAGAMVGLTGILNLMLSLLAARAGFFYGIAAATLLAQSFFGITTGYFSAREFGLSKSAWIFRGTGLPVIVMTLAFILRSFVYPSTLPGICWLLLSLTGLIAACGVVLGINRKLLVEEWFIMRSMLGK